jgi:hypothetical protein
MIDDKTYELPVNNYFNEQTIKKQIIMTHSSSRDMRHFIKWKNRLNGNYKKTAAFTIDVVGNIYQHYDPIYFSELFGNLEQDKKNIIILLENEGWLTQDIEKNQFIDWGGYIYNRPETVFERKWRGYTYWAPYSTAQFDSALFLVNKLCDEFYIPKKAIPHNTKIDNIDGFEGVLYKSNFEKHYTDLSPAWSCENFKYKLENQ